MRAHAWILAATLSALVLSVATEADQDAPRRLGGDDHTVTIVGHIAFAQYVPPVLMVPAGDTVAWSNQGTGAPHTATATPVAPTPWTTEVIPAGATSVPILFDAVGLHYYFCAVHPSTMKGFLYVV